MQIEYVTGREYDGEQVLLITVESEKQENFEGYDAAGYVELTVNFIDRSRNIKGRVTLPMINKNYSCHLLGRDLLMSYDMGLYQSI